MRISDGEIAAIRTVLKCGEDFGCGNMISHLQTAWAERLMQDGMSEASARKLTARDGSGYPFLMQRDLLERGEWDETGERYR